MPAAEAAEPADIDEVNKAIHGVLKQSPDGNLITAGGTGALLWAKQIIGRLGVFRPDTLEAWYAYFSTGEAQHFFALMQTLPSAAQ